MSHKPEPIELQPYSNNTPPHTPRRTAATTTAAGASTVSKQKQSADSQLPVSQLSDRSLLALCLVLCLAFFPGIFHWVWTAPLSLISSALTDSASALPSPLPLAAAPATVADPQIPTAAAVHMAWFQKEFSLAAKSRGCYLVTDQVLKALPELSSYKVGLLHLFMKHTSAAIGLNENWDSDVRSDMSKAFERLVPRGRDSSGRELYDHNAEGDDDMPAHIKAALVGNSVSVPIRDGKLATGTWQGIWYFEFRDAQHTRTLVATIQGEKK